jgi:hypothetical protein
MSLRRTGSCRHGPRPVSSSRRSSASSIDSVQESSEESSPPYSYSGHFSWSLSTTSSFASQSSVLLLPHGYENPGASDAEWKRRTRIRRSQREKPQGPRPLPPIPQLTFRPSLSLDMSLSTNHNRQSRRRWLPVPPLPMTPFPTGKHKSHSTSACSLTVSSYLVAPTECSSPVTTLPPPMEYPQSDEEIDWCMIDEIVASFDF